MKVFVTGVAGQLGHDVINELSSRGIDCIGSDLAPEYSGLQDGTAVTKAKYIPIDITDQDQVWARMVYEQPDAVIHCAAWTAVDAAEDEENHAKVSKINVAGTASIVAVCKELDIPMLYLSTDYVFPGNGEEPWKPDSKDYAPLNYYGDTKLSGENVIRDNLFRYFIVRIAWVFGANGNNFVKTMLKVGKNHDELKVVDDQIGTPTYTLDLARLLVDMIQTDSYGTYHATNEGGYISWYDFAKEIFAQAAAMGHPEYDADHLTVHPVTTEEYGVSKAKRPHNSRLDKSKLVEEGFTPLPDWKDALKRYLEQFDFSSI